MDEHQYIIACRAMLPHFEKFSSYLQEGLKEQVMTASYEDFKILQTKYNYLTELLSIMKNEDY